MREVIQAGGIEDAAAILALFRQIGTVSVTGARVVTYETEAAVQAGEAVWRELRKNSSSRCHVGRPADVPPSFAEDRNGAVWIGFEHGGLARHHNDSFSWFTTADGALPTLIARHVDQPGRLWAASANAGLSLLHDVAAERPRFTYYTTAQGLTTNGIRCLTEDQWGRLYLGIARGVDRLDPATGRVRRLTTNDGLASDFVTAAYRDRAGALWFGTTDGVSRLVPGPDPPGGFATGLDRGSSRCGHAASDIRDRRTRPVRPRARANGEPSADRIRGDRTRIRWGAALSLQIGGGRRRVERTD